MSALELKVQLEESRRVLDLANLNHRLENSKEFREVIYQNLFIDKSLDLVSQLALFSQTSTEYQSILRELDAISYLRNYLTQLNLAGAEAQVSIIDAQSILNGNED